MGVGLQTIQRRNAIMNVMCATIVARQVKGHWSPVCFTKYIRKPAKGAQALVTTAGSTSTPPSLSTTATASASTSTLAKSNNTQADLLAELMKRIKDQDAQIKALNASF
jgi:hypothetical protein